MHENLLARTKKGGVNIAFFGDSITQGWGDAAKAMWTKHFEPLGAVNYGIGGDSTRQVLWRLTKGGELNGVKPKLVVLKIGTNNLYDDHNGGSDEEIAKGVEAIVDTTRRNQPDAKILLLGILPRQNEFFSSRIRRINTLLSKFADGKSVHYMDLDDKFEKTPGKGDVYPDLFVSDKLHLSAKGYEILAQAISATVKELAK